jgi:hypothetical protein
MTMVHPRWVAASRSAETGVLQYHPCPALSFECAYQDAVVRPVWNTTSAADPYLHRVLPSQKLVCEPTT